MQSMFSGMKKPSMYKLFDRSYLSGFGIKNLSGMDGVWGGVGVMYDVLGAFVHFFNVFTLYGLMVIVGLWVGIMILYFS